MAAGMERFVLRLAMLMVIQDHLDHQATPVEYSFSLLQILLCMTCSLESALEVEAAYQIGMQWWITFDRSALDMQGIRTEVQ